MLKKLLVKMKTSEEIECNSCGGEVLFGKNNDDVWGPIIKIEELCDDITYYCSECSHDDPDICICRQCDILSEAG